ncbi:MAG TPA: ABC transporter ATP-binding protein [Gemmatimonadaceae bacterium]|jgi:peptide/nickel transport system ATP-binding protein|nr:ABC transporter ATP-binding protein [Gemmatimonadaceae bacterium]
MTAPVLTVRDLRTVFDVGGGGTARAVDGITFDVAPGEAVGLVGESGSGKSVTALSLLRLIRPPGAIDPGSQIVFDGADLMTLDAESLRRIRGRSIAMIFQEPMTALNPVYRVGDQIAEVLRVHGQASEAWERAVEMLRLTGIPDPAARARAYPHQLSGGMRQRVMIAMALVMHPALVIADEPTTALDVTVQAQILALLADLRARFQSALLLITHDLGVIAESTSRVIVMYAGEIVESAPVGPLFATPHHPYTRGLLAAVPRLSDALERRHRLADIPGSVPPATDWPTGCRFRTRCASAWERCAAEHPPLYQIGAGHTSRCHLADEPERRR